MATEKLKKKLWVTRNKQFARMIQYIVSFTHYTVQNDMDQNWTLVQLIWSYLENHYNITTKGDNFLSITEHT